jgi:hypothetical protein
LRDYHDENGPLANLAFDLDSTAMGFDENFFVGSGVVEAGCRTVIGQRLKQSGMRWSVRGANAIIALRCCILSGRFEDFWASRSS